MVGQIRIDGQAKFVLNVSLCDINQNRSLYVSYKKSDWKQPRLSLEKHTIFS